MFDFGLGELLLVGIVALIVLGPERLPEAARTAGRLIGKLQRLVSSVKQEFNTQVELEELRKAKQEFEAAAAQVRDSIKESVRICRTTCATFPTDSNLGNACRRNARLPISVWMNTATRFLR